ncbi:hypothetical protein NDU88_001067 [Pleurodeles waltl]|uniref:Uncharacterized protein n=1 Tax=Pleurodeles waltl TaxID=8319 RepID=A0AAV7N9R2_PLEWA|nr:hypothetical protein NDU88_001067 [Pleurodeles waltl]
MGNFSCIPKQRKRSFKIKTGMSEKSTSEALSQECPGNEESKSNEIYYAEVIFASNETSTINKSTNDTEYATICTKMPTEPIEGNSEYEYVLPYCESTLFSECLASQDAKEASIVS